MTKWISNGHYGSPNEEALLGQRVALRQGSREWRGILHMIRANTRGNHTLAVGREPVWQHRKRPFTIEAIDVAEIANEYNAQFGIEAPIFPAETLSQTDVPF